MRFAEYGISMNLLATWLVYTLLAAAPPPIEIAPPPSTMEIPYLIVLQRGTDVMVRDSDSGEHFDFPNGAWGIEVVAGNGGAYTILSPVENPSAVWHWEDLALLDSDRRAAIEKFAAGGDAYRDSRLEEADSILREALAYARATGDAELIAQTGYLASVLHRRLGLYSEATELLRTLTAQAKPEYFRASLYYALGSTLERGGDPDAATSALNAAVELARVQGDDYGEVVALRQLCYVVHRVSAVDALPCYEKLRSEPLLVQHPTIEASVLDANASALEDLGHFEESVELFGAAIKGHQSTNNDRGVAVSRYNLANTQKQMGQYIQALGNYLQAFSYFREGDWRSQMQTVVGAIADVYRMLGDPVLAEAWFTYGIQMHWSDDVEDGTHSARIALADLYIHEGRLDTAATVLEDIPAAVPANLSIRKGLAEAALASANGDLATTDLTALCEKTLSVGNSDFIARCTYWEASQALLAGELDRVDDLVSRSTPDKLPADMVLALDTLGTRALVADGRYEEARQRVRELIDGLFLIASQVPSWHVFNFNQLHGEVWDLAMLSIWKDDALTGIEKADQLWIMDRYRHQLILRGFERDSEYLASTALSLDEVNGWSDSLLEGHQIPFEISSRLLEIDVATPVSDQLLANVNTQLPITPTVSYWLGSEISIGLVATRSSVVAVDLPARGSIDRTVARALRALSRPNSRGAWNDLDHAIWRPMTPYLPAGGSLNIAPDGVLATVPFEAFGVDDSGKLVLDQYELAYTHGAFEEPGNPWRGSPEDDVTIFAGPDYKGQRPDLTQAQGEVDIAKKVFSEVEVLSGDLATRSALLGDDPTPPRILHLAAHGRWDAVYPAHSGVWMSEPDGFVSAREFATSKWPTKLTVLSACSTNVRNGKLTSGPVQSVALAAMVAGGESVIATLWDIPDTAALAFSESFYAHLAQGQTVREATRNAKIAMRDDKEEVFWKNPVFWAAYQPWVR